MQKISLFLLLFFSALTAIANEKPDTSAVALPSQRYLDLMEQADEAIASMKWDEAEQALKEALRAEPFNPTNVILYSNLGMVQYYNGEDSLALDNLTTAHRLVPGSTTVLQNRAKVLTSMQKIPEAIKDYATVMALDSTLVEPLFYHAMLTFNSDSIDTAKKDIELLKTRFPDSKYTTMAEGNFLAYTGQFKEAIPLLTKIIDKSPTAGDYSTRAMCYLMTEQLAEAAEDIARGLELDPTDGELYLYRAILNKLRFRPEDAHTDAQNAIRFGVDSRRIAKLEL